MADRAEAKMYKSISFLCCCTVLFFGSSLLTGCSLAGFGLGQTLDPGQPEKHVRVPEELRFLAQGSQVIVSTKDGAAAEGLFQGIGQLRDMKPVEEYRKEFEQWRIRIGYDSSGKLPAYGTGVRVGLSMHQGTTVYAGRFAGFDQGVIRILTQPGDQVLSIKQEYVGEIRDSLGNLMTTRETIVQAIIDGVPIASLDDPTASVMIQGHPGIPLGQIESMVLPAHPGAGKWFGLVAGLAVDAVAITAIVNSIDLGPDFSGRWGSH
jgi:hypothetical protein